MAEAGNNWEPRTAEVARLRDRVVAGQVMVIARIEALEEEVQRRWLKEEAKITENHRRTLQISLVVLGSFVLPLAVLGVLAILHLSGA